MDINGSADPFMFALGIIAQPSAQIYTLKGMIAFRINAYHQIYQITPDSIVSNLRTFNMRWKSVTYFLFRAILEWSLKLQT